MIRVVPKLLATLYCIVAVLVAGCGDSGPETYRVSGTVSYGGKVVPVGRVTFLPNGPGQSFSGKIESDGSYSLNAEAGPCKVTVIALRELPKTEINKDNWAKAFSTPAPPPYVPAVFSDPDTSPLKFTVEPIEDNSFDIAIPKRKKRR